MWTGPGDDNWDIYVKAVGVRSDPVRLTQHAADDRVPVWSPDGRQIAFLRVTDEGTAIYTMSSLGGRPQRLTDVDGVYSGRADPRIWRPQLAWAAEGGWLAVAETASGANPVRVSQIFLSTLERRPLTTPPAGGRGDVQLALSSDGSHLALVRKGRHQSAGAIWIQAIGGGAPRRVTAEDFGSAIPSYFGLAWAPDDEELVFAVITTDRPRIFRVPVSGGDPVPAGIGQEAVYPSLRRGRMVYEQWAMSPLDIWRVPGRNAPSGQEPKALITSSRGDHCPAYSPDGRRIAFGSTRSGSANIWICDQDGSNPFQLTDLTREAGMPRWSPDGRTLLFDARDAGDSNIYAVDAEGGIPRRLTPEPSEDYNPSWSRDGRWVYFSSDRGKSREIWKVAVHGGPAVQVTQKGGFDAAESWDGQHLYYSKTGTSGLWRMPVVGGEETVVLGGPLSNKAWALARSGLYYATSIRAGGTRRSYVLRYRDFESGQETELYRRDGSFRHESLAVSPDERWVLHCEEPTVQSELMLVENFH